MVLGNEKVCVLKNVKILGLMFDFKLDWYHQTVTAIEEANKASFNNYFKIFLHSRNSKIVNCTFLKVEFTMEQPCLWQASSKMLEICQKDCQGHFSFKTLHKISGIAAPEMWSNYSAACCMYNVINTCVPEDTFFNLTEKSQGLQFTRSNRLKTGFNCLSNCLQKISFSLKNCSIQDSNVVYKQHLQKKYIFLMNLQSFKKRLM